MTRSFGLFIYFILISICYGQVNLGKNGKLNKKKVSPLDVTGHLAQMVDHDFTSDGKLLDYLISIGAKLEIRNKDSIYGYICDNLTGSYGFTICDEKESKRETVFKNRVLTSVKITAKKTIFCNIKVERPEIVLKTQEDLLKEELINSEEDICNINLDNIGNDVKIESREVKLEFIVSISDSIQFVGSGDLVFKLSNGTNVILSDNKFFNEKYIYKIYDILDYICIKYIYKTKKYKDR